MTILTKLPEVDERVAARPGWMRMIAMHLPAVSPHRVVSAVYNLVEAGWKAKQARAKDLKRHMDEVNFVNVGAR